MSVRVPLPFKPAELSLIAIGNEVGQLASVHAPRLDELSKRPANAFFEGLREDGEIRRDNKALTDNLGMTNASSLSPVLDLFSGLSNTTDSDTLGPLLDAAWKADSLLTLRTIFYSRSVPQGKGEREGPYRALAWLLENHPKTFFLNLRELVRPSVVAPKKKKTEGDDEDGFVDVEKELDEARPEEDDAEKDHAPGEAKPHAYWKDLLNMLVLASMKLPGADTHLFQLNGDYSIIPGCDASGAFRDSRSRKYRGEAPGRTKEKRKERKQEAMLDVAARVAEPKTAQDKAFRAFHLFVARMFADQLDADLAVLNKIKELKAASGESNAAEARQLATTISLAAKWAPSEGGFHSKFTSVESTIAEMLVPFPAAGQRTPAALKASLMTYRVKYLVPLRAQLDVLEVKLSKRAFDQVDYQRVPSVAMSKSKKIFISKDGERFGKYMEDVASGKAKISGAALTPAGLLKDAIAGSQASRGVAEAQWVALREDLKKSGKLSKALAMPDVSGSMYSPTLSDGTTPMDHSIALGILISEVCDEPWKGSIMTFSERPHFIDLTGSLAERHSQIQSRGVGYNTDFAAAIRRILDTAVKQSLTVDQMVETVFCFSDMQFDHAETQRGEWKTHHQLLSDEFAAKGYKIPQIVYWNLAAGRRDTRTPVTANEPGTALVNGYSGAILKAFLDGDDLEEVEGAVVVKPEMTPEGMMSKALGHKSFVRLRVVD